MGETLKLNEQIEKVARNNMAARPQLEGLVDPCQVSLIPISS